MFYGGKRASASPTKSIYSWWGYNTARKLFHSKKIVHKEHFKLIHWDGMDKLMNKWFPRMFGNFFTKHVSRCCGVNRYLSKWHRVEGKLVENVSPSCGQRDETTSHITCCCDDARDEVFHASVDKIVD